MTSPHFRATPLFLQIFFFLSPLRSLAAALNRGSSFLHCNIFRSTIEIHTTNLKTHTPILNYVVRLFFVFLILSF